MNSKLKIAITLQVIITTMLFVMMFFNILIAARFPDKDLRNVLSFIINKEYTGLTMEECESRFGECERSIEDKCMVYSAGCYNFGLISPLELYIYFDDEGVVKTVRLKEVEDL